jgi:hypothetical protein
VHQVHSASLNLGSALKVTDRFLATVTLGVTSAVHADLYANVAVARRFELFLNGQSAGNDSLNPVVMYWIRLWIGSLGWPSDVAR